MYKKLRLVWKQSSIKRSDSRQGVSLETHLARIMENNEEPDEISPVMYTERKHGVMAEFNVRTDKTDLALLAMEKVQQGRDLVREQKRGELAFDSMTTEEQAAFNTKFPTNKHAVKIAMAAKAKES